MHLWQMLNKLKQYWKVKNKELLSIVCTFAITGINTAWLGKKVYDWPRLDYIWNILVGIKNNSFNFWYQVIILMAGYCLGRFLFSLSIRRRFYEDWGFLKNKWSMVACPSKKFREMI